MGDYLVEHGERHWTLSDQVHHVEQRNRILTLVRRGATAERVAELLTQDGHPVRPEQVRKLIKSHLERLHSEDRLTIEEMREQENHRLDEAMRIIYPQVLDGNLKAIDRFTRLSERRAKLNGLDAPQRFEFSGGSGLGALGISKEIADQSEQAFVSGFREDDIPDVEVVEDEEQEQGAPDDARGQEGPEQGVGVEGRQEVEPEQERAGEVQRPEQEREGEGRPQGSQLVPVAGGPQEALSE